MTKTLTTVFVTGAGGFVGQAVCRSLLASGFKVRAFELKESPHLLDLQKLGRSYPKLTVIEGDIRNKTEVFQAIGDATHVVHSAALLNSIASYQTFANINIEGTRNTIEAAIEKGLERFLLVSTSDVFGIPKPSETISEGNPYKSWHEPYADTKIQACQLLKSYHKDNLLDYTIIYPGWVYGPGDKQFFPAIIEMLKDEHVFLWHRQTPYKIDFIYIDDLVDGIISALFAPAAKNEDFLILNDESQMTPEDIFRLISAHLDIPIKLHKIPYPIMMLIARASQWLCIKGLTKNHLLSTTDVKAFGNDFHFTTEKARTLLDWHPKTSEIKGVERYFQWIENTETTYPTSTNTYEC